jgi:hypothetical protein
LVRAPRRLDRAGAIHRALEDENTHKDSHVSEFPKGIRLRLKPDTTY